MAGPLATAVLAGLMLAADPQPPISSFQELGQAVTACVRSDAPAAGSQLELRFTLTARGTLIGRPVVVVAHAATTMAAQRALVSTFLDALRRCVPFSLTPAFAQAIAGQPVTLRVTTGGRAVVV